MNTPTTTTALVLALLACTVVALATPASAEQPNAPADECPVVAVTLYDPYLSVHPECLVIPPDLP